jgi:hypothetical protein
MWALVVLFTLASNPESKRSVLNTSGGETESRVDKKTCVVRAVGILDPARSPSVRFDGERGKSDGEVKQELRAWRVRMHVAQWHTPLILPPHILVNAPVYTDIPVNHSLSVYTVPCSVDTQTNTRGNTHENLHSCTPGNLKKYREGDEEQTRSCTKCHPSVSVTICSSKRLNYSFVIIFSKQTTVRPTVLSNLRRLKK